MPPPEERKPSGVFQAEKGFSLRGSIEKGVMARSLSEEQTEVQRFAERKRSYLRPSMEQAVADSETKHMTMREEVVLCSVTEASQQRQAPHIAHLSS